MHIILATSVYQAPKPDAPAHPPLPAGVSYLVSANSRSILARGNENASLCGVINIRSGVIDLRPLTPDEDYRNAAYTDRHAGPHITHFDPAMGNATSHEQLVGLLGGVVADYIGFTVRLGTPSVLVCTSRGLNGPKFNPSDTTDGRMNASWAGVILPALAAVSVIFEPLPPPGT